MNINWSEQDKDIDKVNRVLFDSTWNKNNDRLNYVYIVRTHTNPRDIYNTKDVLFVSLFFYLTRFLSIQIWYLKTKD